MKVLIIGAGAVGTIYGRYLTLGGAEVSFFVKEKYAQSCQRGFRYYDLNRPLAQRNSPIEMVGFPILTKLEEVQTTEWDYVFLTITSTHLKNDQQSGWLELLFQSIGKATLVSLQPGINDRQLILNAWDESRLIEGSIPSVSYAAPLPGESRPAAGVAYWLPPASPGWFSGSPEQLKPLVNLLIQGGFPARLCADVRQKMMIPNVVLTLFVLTLEISGWSFKKLKDGDDLNLAYRGIREAAELMSLKSKTQAPVWICQLMRPAVLRGLIALSRSVVPFNFELYLKVHFTKVQSQMHETLKDYLSLAKEYHIVTPALTELSQRLFS